MKLVTFGCSWIYGDELGDLSETYRNTHNLGFQIYKDYQFDDYINYGGNGASNERIVLQLLEYINSEDYSEDDLLIVGLTSLARDLHYINYHNYTFTIPHWHLMHLQNHGASSDSDFIKWIELTGKYILNSRNESKRYMLNCLSIKSIIGNNPCVVFQSIDNVDTVISKDDSTKLDKRPWMDVPIQKYSSNANEEEQFMSTKFKDKSAHESVLYKDLKNNQFWLNMKMESWQSFLDKIDQTSSSKNVYASDIRTHPSEYGIELWYSTIIKKYIDKIFGSLK